MNFSRPGPAHARLRRNALRLAAILAAALPLTFASHASAVPDASCQPVPDAGATTQKFAQTFTAQNTGQLTAATMRAARSAGTTEAFQMEIRTVDMAGVPTDTVLASESLPAAGFPDDTFVDVTASFSSPASVTAGQQYAVGMSRGGNNLFAGGKAADPCAGAAYSAAFADPFTPLCPAGSCWDWIFAVFVDPPGAPAPATPAPAQPTTALTGQRAAALKKCKKKKRGRARARCKKKANRLPV